MQILRFSATNFKIKFGNINLSFTSTRYLSVVARNIITSRFHFKPSSVQRTWETSIFSSFNNFFVFGLPLTIENTLYWTFFAVVITSDKSKVNHNSTVLQLLLHHFFTFSYIKIKLIEENRLFTTCPFRMNSWKKIFRKIDFSVTLNNLHFQFLFGSFRKHRSKRDAEFCFTLWICCC